VTDMTDMTDTAGKADTIITYRKLRNGGACAGGIRAYFPALRAAGVRIPHAYSELSVPLIAVLDALGAEPALDAIHYARLDAPWLRLFAADCAERALLRERAAGREPNHRSWTAVEVARRYVRGDATDEDLAAARDAACSAACSAARDAARNTVCDAASDAAWRTARDAAWSAACDAVMSTVWSTARDAAKDAAENAERQWQAERIRLYLAGAEIPPVTTTSRPNV